NSFGGSVSVLLGNGNGTFQPARNFNVGSGPASDPIAVAVGDFRGIGRLDLAVLNDGDFTISVLLNNGSGTFQATQTLPTGQFPTAIAVGDFNGDHKLDLVVVNSVGDTINVFLGNGDGTFQPSKTFSVTHNS